MTDQATALPDKALALIQAPNFAYVGTISADGAPHLVPVWVDLDGELIAINSAAGRAWPTNAERDGRITVLVPDKENPYEYASVKGRVVEITTDGADDHIDAMSKKYMGVEDYPWRKDDETRIIVRIRPESVSLYPKS